MGETHTDPLEMDDLLRSLGPWIQRDEFPPQVSRGQQGQQQRCSIGRALAKRPCLLLCDEPTGALDYGTSKEVLALVERVCREHGCTTIIVTHNEAIGRMATRRSPSRWCWRSLPSCGARAGIWGAPLIPAQ